MTDKPIRLITTGGTIDETGQDAEGMSLFSETHVGGMLRGATVSIPVLVEVAMLKESRRMTDADREVIARRCSECPENRILITHGTYTMADTARYLGERISDKTIVLFGSLVPFTKEKSEAVSNLQFALDSLQKLPVGVYVAMEERVFNWDNLTKNPQTGTFETISED